MYWIKDKPLLWVCYTVHILMLLQSLNNIIWVAVVSSALFVFHIVYVLADIWNRLYVWVDRKEKCVALVLIKMVDSQCFTPWLTLIDTTSSEHLSHNRHKTREKKGFALSHWTMLRLSDTRSDIENIWENNTVTVSGVHDNVK